MSSDTYTSLSGFAGGERILNSNSGLEEALETLDNMKCSELGTVLMHHAAVRVEQVSNDSIIGGNQFATPSSVSQRDFHRVEGLIMNELENVEFVEIAPLQPLGTSSILAGTNQKMIMPALRNSEVNSDATTSLFREAYARHTATGDAVHLATSARITRVQTFDPETGFLPHFKMFAQVTVGKAEDNRGPEELDTLSDHLASDVAILDAFSSMPEASMDSLDINVSNVIFAEELLARGVVSREEARKRTQDPSFNLLERLGIELGGDLRLADDKLLDILKGIGIHKGSTVLERFRDSLERRHPSILPRLAVDIGRVAGIGYYRHLCYRINATNNDGLRLPLVDGGTTEWVSTVDPRQKLTYTVTSGIGTELLAKHYLRN